jgi:hypothetical protein
MMFKKINTASAIIFGITFVAVLYIFPRTSNHLAADGYSSTCAVVEASSMYYQKYCSGYPNSVNNYYSNPSPTSYNTPSYNYNLTGRYNSFDEYAALGACDVVEHSSVYFQKYCLGRYNYSSAPTTSTYNGYQPVYYPTNAQQPYPSSYTDSNGYICTPPNYNRY